MTVIKNKYGFHELSPKPSPEELGDYYASKYFQTESVGYLHTYSPEERLYIENQLVLKYAQLEPFLMPGSSGHSILDIGCGEGFTLPFFANKGWRTLGTDFSEHAIRHHNPDHLANFIAGDFETVLRDLIDQRESFTVVWLDNVLEHVIDPFSLLALCHDIVLPGGLIMVDVPNDFSLLQLAALERGCIDRKFWVVQPDHLSYFNGTGLRALAEDVGWEHCCTVSDFPIDFNLFNSRSNYIQDPTNGKAAHLQRIALVNLFTSLSPKKTLGLYAALADMGIGRSINSIFRKPA